MSELAVACRDSGDLTRTRLVEPQPAAAINHRGAGDAPEDDSVRPMLQRSEMEILERLERKQLNALKATRLKIQRLQARMDGDKDDGSEMDAMDDDADVASAGTPNAAMTTAEPAEDDSSSDDECDTPLALRLAAVHLPLLL